MKKKLLFWSALALIFTFTSCDLLQEEPPTKTQMEGVWLVTKAYDLNSAQDITQKVNFPLTGFHLSSDGTIISMPVH